MPDEPGVAKLIEASKKDLDAAVVAAARGDTPGLKEAVISIAAGAADLVVPVPGAGGVVRVALAGNANDAMIAGLEVKQRERDQLGYELVDRRLVPRLARMLNQVVDTVGVAVTDNAQQVKRAIHEQIEAVLDELTEKLHEFTRTVAAARPTTHSDRSPPRFWNIPLLPAEYIPPVEAESAKSALLATSGAGVIAIAGQRTALAVQGMGGVGKTLLAIQLANDSDVRAGFDGIYWISIGRERAGSIENTLGLQADLAQAVSGHRPSLRDVQSGRAHLRGLLATRKSLLILDDIWRGEDVAAFDALGAGCRLLLTTRDAAVARAAGAASPIELGRVSEPQALEILARYAGVGITDLPPEAGAVANACGLLPLALAMSGAMVKGRPASRWAGVLESLRNCDHQKLKTVPGYEAYPHLLASLQVSVNDLTPLARERYLDFAVFPEDISVPEDTLVTFWATQGLGRRQVQDLVDEFVDRSLARREGSDRLQLHDLQHDLVRSRAGDLVSLHRLLVDSYRRVAPAGLHEGPRDGYFFQRIATHVRAAEGPGALRRLLLDPRWLESKLGATDLNSLLLEFELLDLTSNDPLRLLRDSIRLSAHVLEQRPEELPSQLLGRLLSFDLPEIVHFLEEQGEVAPRPWLRPLRRSLTPPGGALLRTLEGHQSWVRAVTISPDGKTAVSGSDDRTLKVWELDSGKLLRTLEDHQGQVLAVAASSDGKTAVSGSFDKTLKVWDLTSGKLLRTLKGHQGEIFALAVSPDGKTAVSGSFDNTLKVWDLTSGQLLRTLEGHQNGVRTVAVSPDGKTAVSGSDDRTLKLWKLDSGKLLRTLEGHQGWVRAVAVSPDGKTAVSGSDDRTLKVWELDSGKLLRTFEGHQNGVFALAVSPDGKIAVSGSFDKTLKVWDLTSGKLVRTLEGHQDWVYAVAVSPDGKTAVSGSDDRTLKVWELDSGKLRPTHEDHQREVLAVGVSSDGKTAVSGSDDGTLKVWEVDSGKILRTLEVHQGEILAVAVSPDGKSAVTGCFDGTLKVWELDSGKMLRTLEHHLNGVYAVAVSPDGKTAASASDDKTLKVWELNSGKLLRTLEDHQGQVLAVAVSSDGKTAVSGSVDRTLKVWELDSGKLLRTLKGHQGGVFAVAVSLDGKTVVSGSFDKTLKVWELHSGTLLRTLEGHQDRIHALAVSPDGKNAVSISGSFDKTLKVWELVSGKMLASFSGDASFRALAMVPHRQSIFAGDHLGRLHLLALES